MSGKRILYLDPFSGISGDMLVGALLDLGVDLARISHEISKLNLAGYQLSSKRVFRGAMTALKFDVKIDGSLQKEYDAGPDAQAESHEHGHEHSHSHGHSHAHEAPNEAAGTAQPLRRNFRQIQKLIAASTLSVRAQRDSIAAFRKLAEAEGRIHNMPPEDVGFHEVGALDSIIDFVAVCVGLELLGIDEVWCGPVALGRGGFVKCDHGLMPVPAPATLELVKGMTLRDTPVEKELTTPTGAALLSALVVKFCATPDFEIETIGYGAGSREKQAVPNVLRALLGHARKDDSENADEVLEIRANIDDATPETLGYLMERLFESGALDVFYTPIQMKKNRPATLLSVLAAPGKLAELAGIVFKESSTFGLRYATMKRFVLQREIVTVETKFGPVRVKVGRWEGRVTAVHAEYEDCRKLAMEQGVAVAEIMIEAQRAYNVK